MIGAYLDAARLLGRRTAELHLALVGKPDTPDFAPEPYSTPLPALDVPIDAQRYGQSLSLLKAQDARVCPEPLCTRGPRADGKPRPSRASFRCLPDANASGLCACDVTAHLHLGQFLYTGKDFMIIDFEGESARPMSERRRKRSALRDVGGDDAIVHYAAHARAARDAEGGRARRAQLRGRGALPMLWQTWSSWAYLKGYLDAAGKAPFVPRMAEELRVLARRLPAREGPLWSRARFLPPTQFLHVPMSAIAQILRTGPMDAAEVMGAEPSGQGATRFRVWGPEGAAFGEIVAPDRSSSP